MIAAQGIGIFFPAELLAGSAAYRQGQINQLVFYGSRDIQRYRCRIEVRDAEWCTIGENPLAGRDGEFSQSQQLGVDCQPGDAPGKSQQPAAARFNPGLKVPVLLLKMLGGETCLPSR